MKVLVLLITILMAGLSANGQIPGVTPKPLATPPRPVNSTRPVLNTGSPSAAVCDLNLQQAPQLRGLRLGMSEDDASALIGKKFTANTMDIDSGASAILENRAGFHGITFVSLDSFDSKVYSIHVTYDVRWNGIQEYVENFSPKLQLPRGAWLIADRTSAKISCSEFDVRLDYMTSSLTMTDTVTKQRMRDIKAKADQDSKKELQP